MKTAFILDKGQFSSGWDPFLNKEVWVKINGHHWKQWWGIGSLSQISTIDLWAKVMPFRNAKGWLQQLAFGFTCVCLCACVGVATTCHDTPALSPLFSVSLTLSPFSSLLSSCFTECMSGIQNGIHLSVFTAHVHAPSWHSIRPRRRSGLHFSAGRQTGFGLFVNNMKWNQIPGTPVSENWKRSGVCKNKPGLYTPILPIEERIHSQSHSIPVE